MTSQKQTDANRRNALLSTGPQTENGKRRSRCNSIRHGLTAEAVFMGVEDATEYDAFEAEILTEYDPKSVVERELTLRLASLLWRLRRASLIENGLFLIESGHSQTRIGKPKIARQPVPRVPAEIGLDSTLANSSHSENLSPNLIGNGHARMTNGARNDFKISAPGRRHGPRVITGRFLQLASLNGDPLERISRYEAALWRKFLQALYALDQARYHRIASSRGRFTPHAPQW